MTSKLILRKLSVYLYIPKIIAWFLMPWMVGLPANLIKRPVGKVGLPLAPSAAQVRSLRKGSNDQLAITIDSESDCVLNKSQSFEDKGHMFKSLNTSCCPNPRENVCRSTRWNLGLKRNFCSVENLCNFGPCHVFSNFGPCHQQYIKGKRCSGCVFK